MRIQWADLKTFDIIGSGSFGRVFHGDLLGTEVAIKECVRSNSRAFDEKYFKREVDILKSSRHPNIVQFMGICKRKKRFYIVTEFLPLGNLRRWIQDDTKEFGWDTRISFAIDISLALAYLHHKNIIHRDLKGENLLISENMRIKVCDFGFSRVEAKDDDEMRRISYCGTDGYMAPEILLGEDFDCSVDVFSFGIVLAEMMARHVVDEQHFQRIAPDMSVSSDEILFRAQHGCPVELGELAIHCVRASPSHRPKLRHIVERLTSIESMDVHVGTTLVVAPSVARAARNMMRKQEADMKRLEQRRQQNPYQLQNQQHDYENPDTYQGVSSSVHGEAHTWRMTDEENAMSSRRTVSSIVAGSQSTYKGKRWSGSQNDKSAHDNRTERGFHMGSSAIPLVLEERRRTREQSNSMPRRDASFGDDGDDIGLRMPLWDSINSPHNQKLLKEWHESESVHVSTVDGETSLGFWDQEGDQRRGNLSALSQLSSIQLALDDREDDDDGDYGLSSDSDLDDDDSDEQTDSLFNPEHDRGASSSIWTGSRDAYELSSDSDESLSAGSLTTSMVMALDTLEIPDVAMDRLLVPEQQLLNLNGDIEPSSPKVHDEDAHSTVYRKPSLISRLLPPIPTSENPWTTETTVNGVVVQGKEEVVTDKRIIAKTKDNATIPRSPVGTVAPPSPPALTRLAPPPLNPKDISVPPTPPSKSSLLLRTNTIKSIRDPQPANIVDPSKDQAPSLATALSTLETSVSTSVSTAHYHSISPSLASSSSSLFTPEDAKSMDETATGVASGGQLSVIQDVPHRGLSLIRGMSDSALETTCNTIETGSVMTGNLMAAMGAKTWTSGAGGFGHWLGQYTHHDDPAGKMNLKKHTSLKEGKQQQKIRMDRGMSNLDTSVMTEEEQEGGDHHHHHQQHQQRKGITKDGEDVAEPMATVKRRALKTMTGFPHRFSLVIFSTQLLPKCDVCLKRLGMLPGWSSKHLECDDCGYKTHPKCVPNVAKCCTSARKSGVWEIPV
ncbi:hypothetical protein EDD11_005311 [Mortierella claussenii]|nr:hypothetical protein EDD11_005311 [Mortierella claussenii]